MGSTGAQSPQVSISSMVFDTIGLCQPFWKTHDKPNKNVGGEILMLRQKQDLQVMMAGIPRGVNFSREFVNFLKNRPLLKLNFKRNIFLFFYLKTRSGY